MMCTRRHNLNTDFSQADDISKKNPEKLKEMQAAFMVEAAKYKVFPLDDRYIERVNPENRSNLNKGRTKFVYYDGNSRITEAMAPDLK